MILEALDLALQTQKQEQVHLQGFVSVEHLLPQNADPDGWPFPEDGGADDEDAIGRRLARRSISIHTIGNLTLLTQWLNSSLGNRSFTAKKAEILRNSRLQLNAHLLECDDRWDEDSIQARGRELFKIAVRIWPYPEKEEDGRNSS